MSTQKKVAVLWACRWRVTIDADICKQHAPEAWAALEAGHKLPEVALETVNALMKAQDDRDAPLPKGDEDFSLW